MPFQRLPGDLSPESGGRQNYMATKTKTAEGAANGAAKTVTKRKPAAAPAAERASKPAASGKKTTPPKMTTQIPQAVIALRAYFIAEARMSTGESGDSLSDWIEAERQLLAEAGK